MKLKDKKCWKCRGIQSIPCPTCKGRGESGRWADGICKTCLGPGRLPCAECGGVGVVPAPLSHNWRVTK